MAEQKHLDGTTVAILVANGFEQVELTSPMKALQSAGAETVIVSPDSEVASPESAKVRGWNRGHWGDEFDIGMALEDAEPRRFDALLLPGGVMNPDRLRRNDEALDFVRSFFEQGKPVAAICHGPWTLIDAGVVEGRRMTSYHAIQSDLKNAGARWVDEEVVVDQGLITSRNPDDLPAFNDKLIEEFHEGIHPEQRADAKEEVTA